MRSLYSEGLLTQVHRAYFPDLRKPEWDGRDMELDVALREIVGYGFETIVNRVLGKLA